MGKRAPFQDKILSTNSALNALEILREFRGFIDLLITELHISGMNGFEFQKCVENQFHIPVLSEYHS
ncbi:hypothetical protein JHK85_025808 [Glycine max]|nr:hypothetical protein JHK85_025808 [Glycine max]